MMTVDIIQTRLSILSVWVFFNFQIVQSFFYHVPSSPSVVSNKNVNPVTSSLPLSLSNEKDQLEQVYSGSKEKYNISLLLIDHYDSFTYNLYDMISQLTHEPPSVIAKDAFDGFDSELWKGKIDGIILSPGPGSPQEQPLFSKEAIRKNPNLPILGVCLGHQLLALEYGASVDKAPVPIHGQDHWISTEAESEVGMIFQNLPSSFRAVRYHSLAAFDLPDTLKVTATSTDGVVQGIKHIDRPHYGVQFHPESIGTQYGLDLLNNFCWAVQENKIKKDQKSSYDQSYLSQRATKYASPPSQNPCRFQVAMHSVSAPPSSGVSNVLMDPLEAFREFYSSERRAVWLDSSSAKTTGRGSLDIMAAPTSEEDVIEYYLHSGKDILTKLEEQLFTGTGVPEDVIVVNDDFQSHQKVMDKNLTFPPFDYRGGYLGFLGYEVRHDTLRFLQKAEHGTSMVNLGVEKVPYESNVPAAAFFLARRSMVYHHPTQTWHLIGLIEQEYEIEETLKWMKTISGRLLSKEGGITPVTHKSSLTSNPLTFQPNRPKKSYEKDIARCHSFIEQGESYELCLTNQLETRVSQKLSTWDLYSILRLRNPAPYASYLKWNIDSSGSSNSPSPHFSICSSSPERFMSVKRKQRHPRKKIFLQAEAKPIKGTCARVTPKNGVCFSDSEKREDERRARFLQISQKNRAENLMIVDLLRNDISRVCQVGSVHVAKLMDIESFTTVHQMVSTIRGTLSSQKNCIDLLRASFPGGSMTGAPKIRTMELLEELEQSVERGPYAGSLGYISVNGCMDMNIIIRSAVVTSSNKEDGMKITIGAGGAITALSETEDEYDEMMLKARAVVDAVQEWATTGTPEVEPSEIASAIKNSSTNTSFDARQSFN